MTYLANTWRPLSELNLPVTWRWVLLTPHGKTSLCVSVDLALDVANRGLAGMIGAQYFAGVIAPAISQQCACAFIEVTDWKHSSFPAIYPTPNLYGAHESPARPLARSPVLAFHTDYMDDWTTRRMHFGGAGASLTLDTSLSMAGRELLLTLARALFAATAWWVPGNRARMVRIHPGAVTGEDDAPSHPTWRPVTHYSVCTLLEKAPSYPLGTS